SPLQGMFDDIHPGQMAADTFLNASNIKQAWQEVRHPDWSTPLGWTTFGVATVSLAANTVDAAVNVIPVVGTAKGLAEDGIKLGIKGIGKAFAKDAAKETLEIGVKDAVKNTTKAAQSVEQYALRAADSGFYPVKVRRSRDPQFITYLEKGDVWK